MKSAVKAEFTKFFTVRSTYIVSLLALAFSAFLSIYAIGMHPSKGALSDPHFLLNPMYASLSIFATLSAILAILLVAHEYRYNTINYTITAARNRLNVVFAKMTVMIAYALVGGAIIAVVGYFGALFGVHISDGTLVAQQLDWSNLIWQFAAYSAGYAMAGLFIALIVRNLVGSFVVFFIAPVLGNVSILILHDNVKYLPFKALDSIISVPAAQLTSVLSPTNAFSVAYLYLVVAAIVAGVLFVRRDAN